MGEDMFCVDSEGPDVLPRHLQLKLLAEQGLGNRFCPQERLPVRAENNNIGHMNHWSNLVYGNIRGSSIAQLQSTSFTGRPHRFYPCHSQECSWGKNGPGELQLVRADSVRKPNSLTKYKTHSHIIYWSPRWEGAQKGYICACLGRVCVCDTILPAPIPYLHAFG